MIRLQFQAKSARFSVRMEETASTGNIGEAFGQFAASRDDFDVWFKDRVREPTGADLNTPPPRPMSDILSDYQA